MPPIWFKFGRVTVWPAILFQYISVLKRAIFEACMVCAGNIRAEPREIMVNVHYVHGVPNLPTGLERFTGSLRETGRTAA
jgi:hypothetical protein